ncbi:related to transcription activator protein acu-15 [Fusarium torulosum]|uniref:Related to transcription activator protein acu-15 n=1 Tax=Fusarium torulosum TaxID=33205 RepID=A0AAE8MLY8_9HYPO|nr:related to transcription activator protein acu-15 [Fusarium torulosum]
MSQPDSSPNDAQQRLSFRRKRKQVGRACDGCRLQRIKCDDTIPCVNCRTRGRECSNSNTSLAPTLPQAQDEIDKLKRRVKELEAELSRERSCKAGLVEQAQEHTPPGESPLSQKSANLEKPKTRFWDGVFLRPARSPHSAWFGPSSLYFFTHRLSTFLSTQTDHMLIHLATNLELHEQPAATQDCSKLLGPLTGLGGDAFFLTPIQEEYFISLYWETYHTSLYAFIDEANFKAHVQSLYVDVPPGSRRKSSALVDIILAMCMQYHASAKTFDQQRDVLEGNDATMAGRWYYRRAQALMTCEVESPSTSTLQCHILCAVYVCGGSFHNMADTACALAVRTAYMLGLHLDPPSTLPRRERESRRRLWWSVFEIDTKVGIKVGRPFLIRDTHDMPELPSDTFEAAMESGSTFAPIGDNATWLSLNLQRTKLYQIVRTLNLALYNSELNFNEGNSVYDDPNTLQDVASIWGPQTSSLTEWTKQIPQSLKTNRKGGTAFSYDGSILDIEQYAPLWLQRQRLCLELEYHHVCINLHRPFISFSTSQGSMAAEMAAKCAMHAIELSSITRQVLTNTAILNGWHEAFQWQWSAAMTLVGFVVANFQHPVTIAARCAIKTAVEVLDIFSRSFDAAVKAATIVRTMHTNIEAVMEYLDSQPDQPDQGSMLAPAPAADAFLSQFDAVGQDFDLLDMAMDVDFWAELDMLLPGAAGATTQTATS